MIKHQYRMSDLHTIKDLTFFRCIFPVFPVFYGILPFGICRKIEWGMPD